MTRYIATLAACLVLLFGGLAIAGAVYDQHKAAERAQAQAAHEQAAEASLARATARTIRHISQ